MPTLRHRYSRTGSHPSVAGQASQAGARPNPANASLPLRPPHDVQYRDELSPTVVGRTVDAGRCGGVRAVGRPWPARERGQQSDHPEAEFLLDEPPDDRPVHRWRSLRLPDPRRAARSRDGRQADPAAPSRSGAGRGGECAVRGRRTHVSGRDLRPPAGATLRPVGEGHPRAPNVFPISGGRPLPHRWTSRTTLRPGHLGC